MDLSSFLHPHLSPHVLALVRSAYGFLLLLTLLEALPQATRFFTTATHGGYLNPGPLRDLLFRPRHLPLLLGLWLASACGLAVGVQTPLAALVNLALGYYFFVHTRWKGILRGMGAPGLMSCWLGACICFLEFARHHDPTGRLQEAALLAFRVDFAVIMLSAGIYKATAGYPRNQGMELGLVNPWWGYWWRFFKDRPPGHLVFRIANHLAYLVEISGALAMLFPPTRELGAFAILCSFAGIGLQIRLGFLCEMLMLCCLVEIEPGTWMDRALGVLPGLVGAAPAAVSAVPLVPGLAEGLRYACFAYVVLLPFAFAGMYYNFYGRKQLPGPLQSALVAYTNLFGMIIWRVFTIDVINFFVNIRVVDRPGSEPRVYSRPGRLDWSSRFRYLHVGEFVCAASVFTTLKYYPSNPAIFNERLLRYARTVPCPAGGRVLFEYVSIRKSDTGFEFVPVSEFEVDPSGGVVVERTLVVGATVRGGHPDSPVHEGVVPGSYAPASGHRVGTPPKAAL
ncbi:MAG: hypothetical protein HYZ53_22900 [Planctomycetes bacterium]|nr:hypothetical protein [Planctomycetota bacterium]